MDVLVSFVNEFLDILAESDDDHVLDEAFKFESSVDSFVPITHPLIQSSLYVETNEGRSANDSTWDLKLGSLPASAMV